MKILLLIVLLVSAANAQSYTNIYVWHDTVRVTTSVHDSLFTTRWDGVTLYFENGDGYLKIGAPDTTLSRHPWQYFKENQTVVVGPQTPLLKLAWKGGTATKLALVGNKKRAM